MPLLGSFGSNTTNTTNCTSSTGIATLPEHLRSTSMSIDICVALIVCVVFCRPLFSFILIWPLYWLSHNLWRLITTMVSSNLSYNYLFSINSTKFTSKPLSAYKSKLLVINYLLNTYKWKILAVTTSLGAVKLYKWKWHAIEGVLSPEALCLFDDGSNTYLHALNASDSALGSYNYRSFLCGGDNFLIIWDNCIWTNM